MKLAANVIAVVAWVLFLAVVGYPLFADGIAHLGYWIAAVVLTFLVGLIVPSYLLRLEKEVIKEMPLPPSDYPRWTHITREPAQPKREEAE